jgi:hypothetical protein
MPYRPRRLTIVSALAALAACGGGDGGPGPIDPCAPAAGSIALDIAAPLPNANAGSGSVALTGAFPFAGSTGAAAFEAGASQIGFVFTSLPVLDALGRPVAELFFFLDGRAAAGTVPLVPITLAEIKSQSAPPGSFAVYADQYNPALQDYGRWLLSTGGCVRLAAATAGAVGRIAGEVHFDGEWRTREGTPLGLGRADATFDAPLLRVVAPATAASLVDSIEVATSGARSDAEGSRQLVAVQIAAQTPRWLAVGTVREFAGDSLGELWLSLNRLPRSGDVIELADPTVDAALAAEAPTDYGMLRVIQLTGVPVARAVRQLWRSTGGTVTFTSVVQNGPLGVCGYALGRYEFPAEGTGLADDGTRVPLGSAEVSGAFAVRFTVLLPHFVVSPALTGPSPISVATDDVCP